MSFEVTGAGDARLTLPAWTRGFVWVNGARLGRYWSAGPQDSLSYPARCCARAATSRGCWSRRRARRTCGSPDGQRTARPASDYRGNSRGTDGGY
ncbi:MULTISPECIES: hypothetical protein [unclassified Streptomyces]|uniref:hypothetical protein n=1 Tax=unclassified Streptomyces TaxID=2593676 RepID=UPI0038304D8D